MKTVSNMPWAPEASSNIKPCIGPLPSNLRNTLVKRVAPIIRKKIMVVALRDW